MRAQLLPLDGGSPIEIVKELTVVGRKEDCDVRLDHKSVSKMHCVIVKTDGLLLLRDLGSTNGTRVNGQRVRRAALLPNDQLTIAHFKFRVNLGPDAPVPPSPPVPVHAAEHTQALDAREVAHLLRKPPTNRQDDDDESVDVPGGAAPHLQRNPLPDVYPDDFEPRR
jgi:pSer/pThr/pTyr-binding forkhead associated (FHA) protein